MTVFPVTKTLSGPPCPHDLGPGPKGIALVEARMLLGQLLPQFDNDSHVARLRAANGSLCIAHQYTSPADLFQAMAW